MKNNELNLFLSGKKLYGDNFTLDEITKWYEDEKEGYSNLISEENYEYPYYEFDKKYFWKYLPNDFSELNALGIGSAFGKEFCQISDKLKFISIIEPSDVFIQTEISGIPCSYTKPRIDGKIDLEANSFDIIICFSCLHHIPNVSTVFNEMVRVLKPNGLLFIREPITTMRGTVRQLSDFQKPIKGLTSRERGIPLQYFNRLIKENNLKVINIALNNMHIDKILKIFLHGIDKNNSKIALNIDAFLSKIFRFNYKYHSYNLIGKVRPAGVAFVLQKL